MVCVCVWFDIRRRMGRVRASRRRKQMARAKSINVHESKRWPQADTATARALAQSVETVFFAFLLDFCFFFQQIRRWHRIREAPIGSVSIVVAKKKEQQKKRNR